MQKLWLWHKPSPGTAVPLRPVLYEKRQEKNKKQNMNVENNKSAKRKKYIALHSKKLNKVVGRESFLENCDTFWPKYPWILTSCIIICYVKYLNEYNIVISSIWKKYLVLHQLWGFLSHSAHLHQHLYQLAHQWCRYLLWGYCCSHGHVYIIHKKSPAKHKAVAYVIKKM